MKATEFVKKYGWDLAIRDIAALKGGFIKREDFLEHYGFDVLDDLQTLVNACNMVNENGGIKESKEYLETLSYDDTGVWDYRLREAIELVESLK